MKSIAILTKMLHYFASGFKVSEVQNSQFCPRGEAFEVLHEMYQNFLYKIQPVFFFFFFLQPILN